MSRVQVPMVENISYVLLILKCLGEYGIRNGTVHCTVA